MHGRYRPVAAAGTFRQHPDSASPELLPLSVRDRLHNLRDRPLRRA